MVEGERTTKKAWHDRVNIRQNAVAYDPRLAIY